MENWNAILIINDFIHIELQGIESYFGAQE